MDGHVVFDEVAWTQEVRRADSPEREVFLLHYAPLVKALVLRITARLPRGQDPADLVGEGVLGLIDAANRFDPVRGIPFGVYARQRIRGAIFDHLREADPLPRSARDRENKVQALRSDRRNPRTEAEIADLLGIPIEKLRRSEPAPVFLSLDAPRSGAGGQEHSESPAQVPASAVDDPLTRLLGNERAKLVRRAVSDLPERERMILSLYYVEELTMKEVGEVLGITESRVCQIHARTLARMKKKLRRMMEWRPMAAVAGGSR